MAHHDIDDHGPVLPLASSDVGSVSMCSCGVITVTLQYLSLRFEPGAFRELQGLLTAAQCQLDRETGRNSGAVEPATAREDTPNMH